MSKKIFNYYYVQISGGHGTVSVRKIRAKGKLSACKKALKELPEDQFYDCYISNVSDGIPCNKLDRENKLKKKLAGKLGQDRVKLKALEVTRLSYQKHYPKGWKGLFKDIMDQKENQDLRHYYTIDFELKEPLETP